MSEPWLPIPVSTEEREAPRNWLCPEDGFALQDVRPSEDGWIGWCPSHGWQTGYQQSMLSQEPENHPEEEPDEYDD